MALFVISTFTSNVILPPAPASAQSPAPAAGTLLNLPAPGNMVPLSPAFSPAVIKGIKIFPDNPLRFDFIIDTGDSELKDDALKQESTKLIKYFLASLTVPEEDLWVNLSPYEKDRIIPEDFGVTEMGRDLLAQDYLLKQITSSLMYPEDELGQEFWNRIYDRAYELYGTTEIPVNTFNKVWIVPEKAVVYENGDTAFVVESHLKVMLEADYFAMEHADRRGLLHQTLDGNDQTGVINPASPAGGHAPTDASYATEIVREVLLPAIETEVNEGTHFAPLRQIYHSMILATWFKRNLKESLLGKIYVDQNKTAGVDVEDKQVKQKIYDQYIEAFKEGVYNYIREDYDPNTQETVLRKYFSGGVQLSLNSPVTNLKIGKTSSPILKVTHDIGPWVKKIASTSSYRVRSGIKVAGQFAKDKIGQIYQTGKGIVKYAAIAAILMTALSQASAATGSKIDLKYVQTEDIPQMIVTIDRGETFEDMFTKLNKSPFLNVSDVQVKELARKLREVYPSRFSKLNRDKSNRDTGPTKSFDLLRIHKDLIQMELLNHADVLPPRSISLEGRQMNVHYIRQINEQTALLSTIAHSNMIVYGNDMYVNLEAMFQNAVERWQGNPQSGSLRETFEGAMNEMMYHEIVHALKVDKKLSKKDMRKFAGMVGIPDQDRKGIFDEFAGYLAQAAYSQHPLDELGYLINLASIDLDYYDYVNYFRSLGAEPDQNVSEILTSFKRIASRRHYVGKLLIQVLLKEMGALGEGDGVWFWNGPADAKAYLKTLPAKDINDAAREIFEEYYRKLPSFNLVQTHDPEVNKWIQQIEKKFKQTREYRDIVKSKEAERQDDPVGKFIFQLKDKNPDVVSRAIQSLGELGNVAAVDALIETLTQAENRLAAKKAGEAIGKITGFKGVSQLISFVRNSEHTQSVFPLGKFWLKASEKDRNVIRRVLSHFLPEVPGVSNKYNVYENSLKAKAYLSKLKNIPVPKEFLGSDSRNLTVKALTLLFLKAIDGMYEISDTVIRKYLIVAGVARVDFGDIPNAIPGIQITREAFEGKTWWTSMRMIPHEFGHGLLLSNGVDQIYSSEVSYLAAHETAAYLTALEILESLFGKTKNIKDYTPGYEESVARREKGELEDSHDIALDKIDQWEKQPGEIPYVEIVEGIIKKIKIIQKNNQEVGSFDDFINPIYQVAVTGTSSSGIKKDSEEGLSRRKFLILAAAAGVATATTGSLLGPPVKRWYQEWRRVPRRLNDLSDKYGHLPIVMEYIEFMRNFLNRRPPVQDGRDRAPIDFGAKQPLHYLFLAGHMGNLLRNNAPHELFDIIPTEDVQFVLSDKKRTNDFAEYLFEKSVSVESLEALSASDLPVKNIVTAILGKMGEDKELLKKISRILDDAIQKDVRPSTLRQGLNILIPEESMIHENFRISLSESQMPLDVTLERENDYAFKLFVVYMMKYTYAYVLNALGVTDQKIKADFMEAFLSNTSLINKATDSAGEVHGLFGKIQLNLRHMTGLAEIFDSTTHELIHWMSASKETREHFKINPADDIAWLFSAALGEFNERVMRGDLSKGKSVISRKYTKRQGTPHETHLAFRNIPSSEGASWEDVKQYIEDNKGGKRFGDEPYTSYLEGSYLANYAAHHYGEAGSFLVRLYAIRHNEINFAQMELAAAILRNLLRTHELKKSLFDWENRIIDHVKQKKTPHDIDYQLLQEQEREITSIVSKEIAMGSSPMNAKSLLPKTKGGIDLNPENLDLETRGEGIDFAPFAGLPCIDDDGDGTCERIDMEQFENMDINGFTPVIFQIVPITNIQLLLGLKEEPEEDPIDSSQGKGESLELGYLDKRQGHSPKINN